MGILKNNRGFTMVEAIVVIGISIAVLIGAIALGASALATHRANEIATNINSIMDAGNQWFSEISSDASPAVVDNIQHLCRDESSSDQLKILSRDICASSNDGVGSNPYGGNYTIVGTNQTSPSTSAYWTVTATLVPDTVGGRVAKLLSQERNVSAAYSSSTMTVTATYYFSTIGE